MVSTGTSGGGKGAHGMVQRIAQAGVFVILNPIGELQCGANCLPGCCTSGSLEMLELGGLSAEG